MSRFVLSTTESSDKHIPGKLLLEIKSNSTEVSTSLLKSNLGDPDVTFRVGCNTFHGYKSIFGSMSSELKRCFDISGQGFTERTPFQFGGVLKITQSGTSGLTVTVDSKEDVFKLFIDYCYGLKISVPFKTLPSLYLLSKRLDVPSLYVPCADYLSRHVNLDIIGELSRLVEFSALGKHHVSDASETATNGCAAAELQLASAVHGFLLQKADLVASSSTGQLSSRLLVNLTLDSDDLTIDDRSGLPPASCPAGGQKSAFSVLRWCHERVVLGERLARSGSEENVLSDDEDEEASGRAGTISCAGPNAGRDSLSDEATRSDPVGKRSGGGGARAARSMMANNSHQRPTNGQYTRLDLESCSSTDDDDEDDLVSVWERLKLEKRRSTKDVRIALERCDLSSLAVDEADVCIPEDLNQSNGRGSGDGQASFQILAYCPKDGGAETETCLLAPTGLGAGATSIWLGKLTGRLVSLSVKTCRPPVCPAAVGQQLRSASLVSLLSGVGGDRLSCTGASSGNDLYRLNGDRVCSSLEDEAGFTVTPTSASQLAKAAATVCECQVGYDEMSATPRLLETRSGAGAGLLSADCAPLFGDDGEPQLLLLVVGGYTRRGCLDSVELLTRGREAGTLSAPLPGPLLTRLRGRLAVATTSEGGGEPGAVYACGGSNGSVDLASVERLTSQSLSDWLSARAALPGSASGIASSHLGESSQAVASRSVWQTVRHLNQPRSCLCAVGLSSPSGGHLVTPGSVLVAGGLIGATALASVECFDPGRDEWIRLPDMLEGRVGASCAVLPSRQLVVVAGGTSTAATGVCHPCFSPLPACVEALDLRTPAWSILPSPPLSVGTGGLRGCCLLPSPSGQDDLLMIGGFNGREALDTVWRFDSTAWRWDTYSTLKTPRSGACGVTWPDRSCSIVVGGFNMAVTPSGFLDSLELLEPA